MVRRILHYFVWKCIGKQRKIRYSKSIRISSRSLLIVTMNSYLVGMLEAFLKRSEISEVWKRIKKSKGSKIFSSFKIWYEIRTRGLKLFALVTLKGFEKFPPKQNNFSNYSQFSWFSQNSSRAKTSQADSKYSYHFEIFGRLDKISL